MQKIDERPELFLLHGWGTTSEIWLPWLTRLEETFKVTCLDLPGLGNVKLPTAELTLENSLNLLGDKITSNSYLLGWSLGGMLAMLLAQRANINVRGVISIGYNPCFVKNEHWALGMPEDQFESFFAQMSANPQKTLNRFFSLQVQSASESKAILKRLKAINEEVSHSHLLNNLSFLRTDCSVSIKSLNVKSLHFFGELDKLAPVGLADRLPLLNHSLETVVIKGAGHLPFLSDGDLIARKINRYFALESQL